MKNAIECAIRGGYELDLSQREHYDGVPYDKNYILDPLFWQALGKELGWKKW